MCPKCNSNFVFKIHWSKCQPRSRPRFTIIELQQHHIELKSILLALTFIFLKIIFIHAQFGAIDVPRPMFVCAFARVHTHCVQKIKIRRYARALINVYIVYVLSESLWSSPVNYACDTTLSARRQNMCITWTDTWYTQQWEPFLMHII